VDPIAITPFAVIDPRSIITHPARAVPLPADPPPIPEPIVLEAETTAFEMVTVSTSAAPVTAQPPPIPATEELTAVIVPPEIEIVITVEWPPAA
jgi:hypothetical protein